MLENAGLFGVFVSTVLLTYALNLNVVCLLHHLLTFVCCLVISFSCFFSYLVSNFHFVKLTRMDFVPLGFVWIDRIGGAERYEME